GARNSGSRSIYTHGAPGGARRFAPDSTIEQLARAARRARLSLINTSLQRGDRSSRVSGNRFSGFAIAPKTAEAIRVRPQPVITPLKRGVNEKDLGQRPVHFTTPFLANSWAISLSAWCRMYPTFPMLRPVRALISL